MAIGNRSSSKPTATRKGPASRGAAQRNETIGFVLIAGGVLLALSILSVYFFVRFDLTANRAFSLSNASTRLVSELDHDVEAIVYFSEGLPPPFNSSERTVRDILAEYQAASNGRLVVRFVHPVTSEQRQEAESAGVQEVSHRTFSGNRASAVQGYRGMVFRYLAESESIPLLPHDSTGLEYMITTAIKKLVSEPSTIGVITGHESLTSSEGLSSIQRVLPMYTLRDVDATQPIDESLVAVLLIAPQNELSEAELRNIDAFVQRGRGLGIFGGAMKVDLEQGPTATPIQSGINRLLEPWGIAVQQNIVGDARSRIIPVQASGGFQIPAHFPPIIEVSFDQSRPETESTASSIPFRITNTEFLFTPSIETTDAFQGEHHVGTVLARSSNRSWTFTGSSIDLHPRPDNEWRIEGDARGPFALAVAVEGDLPEAFEGSTPSDGELHPDDSRVLVVGSSWMVDDRMLGGAQAPEAQLAQALAFVLNSIDWLGEDGDLIAIRAKTVEEPPLHVTQMVADANEEIEELLESEDAQQSDLAEIQGRALEQAADWEARSSRIQMLNWFGIPALIIAFGLGRWWMRRERKAKIKL